MSFMALTYIVPKLQGIKKCDRLTKELISQDKCHLNFYKIQGHNILI